MIDNNSKLNILITGGAGYIGSHVAKQLLETTAHIYYNEYTAILDLNSCEIIDGKLPNKQKKLAEAWAELHKDELVADWNLSQNGELPFPIDPLK